MPFPFGFKSLYYVAHLEEIQLLAQILCFKCYYIFEDNNIFYYIQL